MNNLIPTNAGRNGTSLKIFYDVIMHEFKVLWKSNYP